MDSSLFLDRPEEGRWKQAEEKRREEAGNRCISVHPILIEVPPLFSSLFSSQEISLDNVTPLKRFPSLPPSLLSSPSCYASAITTDAAVTRPCEFSFRFWRCQMIHRNKKSKSQHATFTTGSRPDYQRHDAMATSS